MFVSNRRMNHNAARFKTPAEMEQNSATAEAAEQQSLLISHLSFAFTETPNDLFKVHVLHM